MAKRKYKSDAFASIHETAEALRDIGAIDKRTMREFDESCLAPLPSYTGRQIRKLRERENVSQPVFAHYLAVSKNLVSDWERGIKKPAGPTKRLLAIVEKRGLAALVA
jgi:putative transcriptional regulator